MTRHLPILAFLLSLISCRGPEKESVLQADGVKKQIDILEPDLDTLPNGKRLLDNIDSVMTLYYKEVVGADTLKGGRIICYGIDDSTKYFYLRHGDTLYLLNQTSIFTSTHSLGTLEKDFDDFFITRIDNGNGVPPVFQIFDKKTGKNILGKKIKAWNYQIYDDSLFFLHDNSAVSLVGNYIDRKEADSVFLFNVASGRREGFKLPIEVPYDSYIDLKRIAKNTLTISWVKIMTDDSPKSIEYRRY